MQEVFNFISEFYCQATFYENFPVKAHFIATKELNQVLKTILI